MISIGIDIGGSSVKAVLAELGVRKLDTVQRDSQSGDGPEEVLRVLDDVIAELLRLAGGREIAGIGVGMAGTIDFASGIVYHPPNFAGWEAVPLGSILEQRWSMPVRLENDANCAALGEAHFGNGRGVEHFVGMTLGTGVGGGIIVNREVYHGERGFAGEIGHLCIDAEGEQCNCGGRGCIEAYAGIGYLMRRALPRLRADERGLLYAKATSDAERLSPKDLTDAALQGDATAAAILAETGKLVGCAIASAANLLDITTFIIGGGVSGAGELLFASMREAAVSRVLKVHRSTMNILPAALGNDAGMLGAAALLRSAR